MSVFNAAGALVAAHGGLLVGQSVLVAPALASVAFAGLAIREFRTHLFSKDGWRSTITRGGNGKADLRRAFEIALPMTLNNLAGGVAGGAAGLSPWITAAYALIASFLTMAAGNWIGCRYRKRLQANKRAPGWEQRSLHPSLVSASLLAALCLLTIYQELL